jgi:excisionase family DNA binding protein
MKARLLTVEEAANMLGVPKGSLQTAAANHGLLVRMGRAVRIDPDTLEDLIHKCREKPQERDSTGAKTRESGSFAIPDAPTNQRAQATAEMLKKPSRLI